MTNRSCRQGRRGRPPHPAAALLRPFGIAALVGLTAGCGGRSQPVTDSTDLDGYVEARLVRRVYPEPPGELLGIRGLAIDSTGALFILDSEDYRIHLLRDERPAGSAGRRGEGPGEFPDTPVYMDAGDDGVLVTVGGSNSRAAFFSGAPSYTGTFSPETLVLQAALAPDRRIVATTLDSPTDPVVFDRSGALLRRIELGNADNAIMDHFIMDAGTTTEGRSLLVVGYHFLNRIQIADLDSGAVIADFSLGGLPPKVDTRPNPSLDLFPEGTRPSYIPAELPVTTMIQNVLLRGDRIYVHVRDHSRHRGREIHELNLDGTRRRIILLPEPAFAVEVVGGGRFYATADTATVVNLYTVD